MQQARFVTLALLWIAFGVGFARRPGRADTSGVRKREPAALIGVFLQGVGYATAWWRTDPSRSFAMPAPAQWLGLLVGATGVALAWWAAHHLGKQWAIEARLVEGHELITTGPYGWVRHPIYSAMLVMLIATGMVVATPGRLAAAVVVFLAGTALRTRLEERLLRDQFGHAFEEYRRRVGWLTPRLGGERA